MCDFATFAYELMPNSSKTFRLFDSMPCLIARRDPQKSYGLPSPKDLFWLIKMGWLRSD